MVDILPFVSMLGIIYSQRFWSEFPSGIEEMMKHIFNDAALAKAAATINNYLYKCRQFFTTTVNSRSERYNCLLRYIVYVLYTSHTAVKNKFTNYTTTIKSVFIYLFIYLFIYTSNSASANNMMNPETSRQAPSLSR